MGQTQHGKSGAPAVGRDRPAAGSRGDVESIGRYLARERRLRGISLQELSATTRLPLRSLERLESGAFDDDPDGFVRGFVRTVARALGLPPEETLSRMLPEVDATAAGTGVGDRLGRRLVLGFCAVALVAGSYVLWIAFTASSSSEAPRVGADWVYRRDAVRELAREFAVHPADEDPASPARPQTEP